MMIIIILNTSVRTSPIAQSVVNLLDLGKGDTRLDYKALSLVTLVGTPVVQEINANPHFRTEKYQSKT